MRKGGLYLVHQSRASQAGHRRSWPAPEGVVRRLSLYLRALLDLERGGTSLVTSQKLSIATGGSASQVRKDLALFGTFGRTGRGYEVRGLIDRLTQILGRDRIWPTVLIGAGHLGTALLGYPGFLTSGCKMLAAFDCDPAKIGSLCAGVRILDVGELEWRIRAWGVQIAMLTVPAAAAQELAHRAVESGVVGILNFAPVHLQLPPTVMVKNVDISVELIALAYALGRKTPARAL